MQIFTGLHFTQLLILNMQHRQTVLDTIKIKYSLIKLRSGLQDDKLEAEFQKTALFWILGRQEKDEQNSLIFIF